MAERQAFGIDINEYSRTGGVNYDLVKQQLQAGVYDFVIIKASLGLLPSKLLDEQVQGCEQHGIPYATYHFVDPRNNIKGQIQNYVNCVGTSQPFYVLDIESPQQGTRVANKTEVQTAADELQRLTQKQPVLYSSKTILTQINMMNEASQYRLWIAQYPYDATRSSQNVQYRYFSDFTKKYAQKLPVTVAGTPLEQSTVIWQFTCQGDGPFYIYNPTTKDPKYTGGMKCADLNVSVESCSEFMKEMFGIDKNGGEAGGQSTTGGGGTTPKPPDQPPYPGLTNQQMINLIYTAAKPFTKDPWQDWIVRAGLESLAIPSTNRNKKYTGLKIEDFANLTDQEKAAIKALMK